MEPDEPYLQKDLAQDKAAFAYQLYLPEGWATNVGEIYPSDPDVLQMRGEPGSIALGAGMHEITVDFAPSGEPISPDPTTGGVESLIVQISGATENIVVGYGFHITDIVVEGCEEEERCNLTSGQLLKWIVRGVDFYDDSKKMSESFFGLRVVRSP